MAPRRPAVTDFFLQWILQKARLCCASASTCSLSSLPIPVSACFLYLYDLFITTFRLFCPEESTNNRPESAIIFTSFRVARSLSSSVQSLQMPVPVPHHSKQPAHLVIKQHCSDDGVNHSFQDLTGILPASPTGPPPSFGTREQWINSLPSWRRSKPRRIWEDDSHPFTEQDFQTGLARADNASAIKGSRAKACPPPFYIQHSTIAPTIKGAATSIDMVPHGPFDTAGMHANDKACSIATNMEIDVYDNPDRGAFTPIFEDDSPEFRSLHEVSSSPVEPVTPFGDFVDRAVSSTSAALSCSYVSNASLAGAAKDTFQLQCYRSHPATQPFTDLPVSVSAPELVTPTATSGYRKLSEPLSEWIAHFVWKACTTGTNIPSSIAQVRSVSLLILLPFVLLMLYQTCHSQGLRYGSPELSCYFDSFTVAFDLASTVSHIPCSVVYRQITCVLRNSKYDRRSYEGTAF